ncbi:hypothetical protein AVEN_216324-1 [Araneus ventricosus]|uniref:Uncharacterized protein n=1 Tax=Araneus ventricosus TaxID=182803 RepID=A0A4Y2ML94_ARAVE|nr:hypothetical protein AVEN_216324-1 [Araneus ventricosus]
MPLSFYTRMDECSSFSYAGYSCKSKGRFRCFLCRITLLENISGRQSLPIQFLVSSNISETTFIACNLFRLPTMRKIKCSFTRIFLLQPTSSSGEILFVGRLSNRMMDHMIFQIGNFETREGKTHHHSRKPIVRVNYSNWWNSKELKIHLISRFRFETSMRG